MALIEKEQQDWRVIQLTPDRNLRNKNVPSLLKYLSEFYRPRPDRLRLQSGKIGVIVDEQVRVTFRIHLTRENVSFYLIIPNKHYDQTISKLSNIWEKATFKDASSEPLFNHSNSAAITMHLTNHTFYSINSAADGQEFSRALLNVASNMGEADQAVVELMFEPISPFQWESDAEEAYAKVKEGEELIRAELSPKAVLRSILTFFNDSNKDSKKKEDDRDRRNNHHSRYDDDDIAMLESFMWRQGKNREDIDKPKRGKGRGSKDKVSKETKAKMQEPVFATWIRIVGQSTNKSFANYLCRNLAGCFRELEGDNEFERKEYGDSFKLINSIYRHTVFKPFGKADDKLSVSELSVMIQLPEEKLQKEFDCVDQVKKKEVNLPSPLYDNPNGVPGGYVTERGKRRLFRYPVNDDDLFCTTDISIGPKGCGKSTKAVQQAVGTINCGYSVFLVDTADGEVIDNARDSLPEWMPDDHIIDLDFGNLMYPFPMNLSDVALSTRAKGDNELGRRVIANKLKDALVLFIKNISSYGDFSDRMEQYVGAAGKAVLRDPQNSILEIFMALTNANYIRSLIEEEEVQHNLQMHETLRGLLQEIEKGSANQKTDPIISRLNKLINNDFASNMFLQRNKAGKNFIDFRKWADGDKYPYFVGIRIPKDDFGAATVNMLTAFVLMKWYLAVLSRTNIPKEKRKPCSLIWDEPHTAIEAAGPILEDIAAEMRKYRGRIVFLAHGPDQFGKYWSALTRGGFTLSLYRTKEVKVFKDLSHVISPFEPEEAFKQLPERYWAINKIAVRGVDDLPAFMAEMCDMPPKVKDRSYRKDQCSKQFGTHYQIVEKDIFKRRTEFAEYAPATTKQVVDEKPIAVLKVDPEPSPAPSKAAKKKQPKQSYYARQYGKKR